MNYSDFERLEEIFEEFDDAQEFMDYILPIIFLFIL